MQKHYRVACITNNVKAGEGPGMAREKNKAKAVAEVMALFDLVVESSVEGVRKPNPEIYTRTCERLGVACSDAIFLDDLGINLKPAKALGMQTIKVVTEDQAINDLASITGLAFPRANSTEKNPREAEESTASLRFFHARTELILGGVGHLCSRILHCTHDFIVPSTAT